MEEKIQYQYSNCGKCIYREKEIGYCWYTMTTDKQNHIENGMCNHFVDKDVALKNIEKGKKIR